MSFHDSYLWRLRKKIGHDLVLMPGASVLVEDVSGKILLTRRQDDETWCMPGGAAEVGGSFLQTALDELREEVGIHAEPAALVPFASLSEADVHTLYYPNGDTVHCFSLWFVLPNWSGKAEVGDEVNEVGFFTPSEFPPNTAKPSVLAMELYRKFRETGKFQVS